MKIPYRPLGKVANIIKSTSLDMTYAYDDLVFSDHSVFIFRFDEDNEKDLHLYFNHDCEKSLALNYELQLKEASVSEGFKISTVGSFQIRQLNDQEEIEILFQEK